MIISYVQRGRIYWTSLGLVENTGERPGILEKVFWAIKTLPPTSVEAERAFSAAGMFVTKLRSRLSEKTIDALIFLRKKTLVATK